jgi:hypothetical protein
VPEIEKLTRFVRRRSEMAGEVVDDRKPRIVAGV